MLAGAGGGTLLGTLLVGLMISYILDVLKMAEVSHDEALIGGVCSVFIPALLIP